MQKSNVKMVVQEISQTAAEFASELECFSNFLIRENNKKLIIPPVITCTSASDGRQTAMIQYFTKASKCKKIKISKSPNKISKTQKRINKFLDLISEDIKELENIIENSLDTDLKKRDNVVNLEVLKLTTDRAIEILKPTLSIKV